jgi:excisionase family DNA binding protein
MAIELLTSAQAAQLLGVGPTTVKRWADAGLISCVKTAGNHRRFPRAEVERLLARDHTDAAVAADAAAWIRLLAGEEPLQEVQASLLAARARVTTWWQVADAFEPVLRELGERWASGELSVIEEHVASERLARALAATAHALPTPRDAPRALLTVAEGEDHTLGLSLAELVLREAGWAARWAGRRTPLAEVTALVRSGGLAAVALSASAFSVNAEELSRQAAQVATACRAAKIPLLLGGKGSWPEHRPGTYRLRTFAQLHQLLETLGPLI